MPPSSTELSVLLLRLYGLAHAYPIDQFQDATLALLKQALPFDSAMWGAGTQTASGLDIEVIHLHEQPQEMLESYQAIRHLDTAAAELTRNPRGVRGFHAPSWFGKREQAPLREYGRRFEQANFFISADGNPSTGFFHWLSLFRADESARCTDRECALLALLSPHVLQALFINHGMHRHTLYATHLAGAGHAICTPAGTYCQRDPTFEDMLRAEWTSPSWQHLPAAVLERVQRGEARYDGRHIVITARSEHGLLFLRARPRCPADALSPRERAVAALAAKGLSQKEIARQLDRSLSTVRNQMQAVYRKLAIGSTAELVHQLRLAE
ncbi:helix-turn-helix domain-containing protein [Thauera linaloolentis]|uniref:LuxR family transcriptional regulator n=1 Tax=Thauera linaloolentis (strain DSM 12138 / JCM 21573 / CCUG 41526 / CIP 105981 / IAM 15112 / NBRC 102519 / 47Lol) TaxID=1123367 RepID=N6YDA0_THAL4|nr:LuxR C-terminal-related transcriptional regulator [Thauera linaloolentis]ENO89505.1 LuxR family transcriptional regulator [Thauera linaloolentis 47Lol = DSM 12138]MCM8565400.1 LuxR C-terminal-related transcriptional regulator [Thauera linaloolentis]